jgi:hypothetical protein
LFLDPIVSSVQRTKTDETDLEAVFTKVLQDWTRPSSARALSIKLQIVLPSIQISKNRIIPKRKKTNDALNLVR